ERDPQVGGHSGHGVLLHQLLKYFLKYSTSLLNCQDVAMNDAVKSPWIIGFGVVAGVHLLLNAVDASPWDSITKCLLAPLLVLWVMQLDGPWLLVAALVFCLGGDLFLEIESLFVIGMASFAASHICF